MLSSPGTIRVTQKRPICLQDGERGPNLRAASWGILKSDGEHERISVGQRHTEQLLCPRRDGVRAEGSPYDPPRVKQGRRGVRDAIQVRKPTRILIPDTSSREVPQTRRL